MFDPIRVPPSPLQSCKSHAPCVGVPFLTLPSCGHHDGEAPRGPRIRRELFFFFFRSGIKPLSIFRLSIACAKLSWCYYWMRWGLLHTPRSMGKTHRNSIFSCFTCNWWAPWGAVVCIIGLGGFGLSAPVATCPGLARKGLTQPFSVRSSARRAVTF
jgi:hypothetical protein